jgi:hypothetical protein
MVQARSRDNNTVLKRIDAAAEFTFEVGIRPDREGIQRHGQRLGGVGRSRGSWRAQRDAHLDETSVLLKVRIIDGHQEVTGSGQDTGLGFSGLPLQPSHSVKVPLRGWARIEHHVVFVVLVGETHVSGSIIQCQGSIHLFCVLLFAPGFTGRRSRRGRVLRPL